MPLFNYAHSAVDDKNKFKLYGRMGMPKLRPKYLKNRRKQRLFIREKRQLRKTGDAEAPASNLDEEEDKKEEPRFGLALRNVLEFDSFTREMNVFSTKALSFEVQTLDSGRGQGK